MDRPLTAPRRNGFDFTGEMRRLCESIVGQLPEMAHIDLARIAIGFSQARKRGPFGLHAGLTPLRFEGGSPVGLRQGRRFRIQPVFDAQGREMLYVLSFYLPRFLDAPFREKLTTVFHELWHVSPEFNGDIRRHGGRCYAHTRSQKSYDADMWQLAERWLRHPENAARVSFLRQTFGELQTQYNAVYGLRIPRPRMLPA